MKVSDIRRVHLHSNLIHDAGNADLVVFLADAL